MCIRQEVATAAILVAVVPVPRHPTAAARAADPHTVRASSGVVRTVGR
jgi:hypothetical protein